MFFRDKGRLLREHQIEELLLRAAEQREAGLDLIEDYFRTEASLDLITKRARSLLQQHTEPEVIDTIRKNFLDCIVVKSQLEQSSFSGVLKKALEKIGLKLGKNREILRAERLVAELREPYLGRAHLLPPE